MWSALGLALFFRLELVEFSKPYRDYTQVFIARIMHGPALVYPNKQTDLRSFSLVPSQWGDGSFRYVMVVEDNTPVFYKPDSTVKPRGRLSVSRRVCVLFKMKEWAFVAEPDYSKAIGWVSLESLGFKHAFIAMDKWDVSEFKMIKETVRGHYNVTAFGRFEYTWRAQGGGLYLKGETSGQFMIYKSVIWAKKETPLIWEDFFFLDADEFLYPEVRVNPKRRAI
jgi:hypothetical protein